MSFGKSPGSISVSILSMLGVNPMSAAMSICLWLTCLSGLKNLYVSLSVGSSLLALSPCHIIFLRSYDVHHNIHSLSILLHHGIHQHSPQFPQTSHILHNGLQGVSRGRSRQPHCSLVLLDMHIYYFLGCFGGILQQIV